MRDLDFTSGAVLNADVDSSEEVAVINTRNQSVLWLSFLVGTANLSAFTVEFALNENLSYFTVASAGADYTSPAGVILDASGDLTTAAQGATVHWLKLNVQGAHAVRIKAAGTSSTITGYYSVS